MKERAESPRQPQYFSPTLEDVIAFALEGIGLEDSRKTRPVTS